LNLSSKARNSSVFACSAAISFKSVPHRVDAPKAASSLGLVSAQIKLVSNSFFIVASRPPVLVNELLF
jgi:hypothetical protein